MVRRDVLVKVLGLFGSVFLSKKAFSANDPVLGSPVEQRMRQQRQDKIEKNLLEEQERAKRKSKSGDAGCLVLLVGSVLLFFLASSSLAAASSILQ